MKPCATYGHLARCLVRGAAFFPTLRHGARWCEVDYIFVKNLGDLGKKREGGVCQGWNFWWWHMRSLWEKNLKIVFLTVAPFIVKFRFEKYRYLLTHLLCLQIFEVLFSDNHSTGPRNVSAVSAFACLVWWYCHFVPKYMMKVKLIKYWMPNILSEKIIHCENGD